MPPAAPALPHDRPASASRWVEPTPALMLRPSGSVPIIVSRCRPALEAAGRPPAQRRRWRSRATSRGVGPSDRPKRRDQPVDVPLAGAVEPARPRPPPGSSPCRAPPRSPPPGRRTSLRPSPPRNLMPLSAIRVVGGRDDAAERRHPTRGPAPPRPGVGMTPASSATPPAATMPVDQRGLQPGPGLAGVAADHDPPRRARRRARRRRPASRASVRRSGRRRRRRGRRPCRTACGRGHGPASASRTAAACGPSSGPPSSARPRARRGSGTRPA